MTFNQKTPGGARETLIERAVHAYGLRDTTQAKPPEPQTKPEPAEGQSTALAERATAPEPDAAPIAEPKEHAPLEPIATPAAPTPAWPPSSQQAPLLDLAYLRESGLIVPGAAPTILSEEFRLIKRQLLTQAFGNENLAPLERGRQILVCSAQPNEGKTYCSVNLALSMASETDIEVVLVDADVAKPEVLSMLGLPAGPGLMDALADHSLDPNSLIVNTGVAGLGVLPAGRQTHNDTELLASPRGRAVLDALVTDQPNRVIIFDSAPALAASPASVLALLVGQIMLVVRADRTTESELREALAMLDGNARIQLLLNSVTFSGSNRKFGYYYGYGDR